MDSSTTNPHCAKAIPVCTTKIGAVSASSRSSLSAEAAASEGDNIKVCVCAAVVAVGRKSSKARPEAPEFEAESEGDDRGSEMGCCNCGSERESELTDGDMRVGVRVGDVEGESLLKHKQNELRENISKLRKTGIHCCSRLR